MVRAVCTRSVTHTRPNEFRVVLVSRKIEREKTGSVHPISADGNGVAHTDTRWTTDSDQAVHLEKMEEANRVSRARSARYGIDECRRIRVSITMEAR